MAGGIDHAVRSGADQVAKGGQKLEQNGGGMRLGVGSDGADGEPGVAVKAATGSLGEAESRSGDGAGGKGRVCSSRWLCG